MKKFSFRFMLTAAILLLVVSPLILLAQTNEGDIVIPDFFGVIFSAPFLQVVATVVGVAQYVKNMLRLKGWYAVALACLVAFGYSFFAYYSTAGLWFTVAVGAAVSFAAVTSYFASKQAGKAVFKHPTGE